MLWTNVLENLYSILINLVSWTNLKQSLQSKFYENKLPYYLLLFEFSETVITSTEQVENWIYIDEDCLLQQYIIIDNKSEQNVL